jgi:uncharacterized protein YkwD
MALLVVFEMQAEDLDSRECLTEEESRLYELINTYRAQHDLPNIPVSPSLTLVARLHAEDLLAQGRLTHGWQDCPYDARDSKTYPCMWQAPKRLGTEYPHFGYENAYWDGAEATAERAFKGWKASRGGHREVILNQGPWDKDWKALGLSIQGPFAVLWVGHEVDPVVECD